MLHQVGDDDGGRAGHAGLAVDEKALSTLMGFLCGTERQAVRGRKRGGAEGDQGFLWYRKNGLKRFYNIRYQ